MIDNAKILVIKAYPRYWEDASVNGIECDDNDMDIPCRDGDMLNLAINLDTGQVLNWPSGKNVRFHLKVCDCGSYYLYDENNILISSIEEGYVPSGVSHGDSDYGDYIIMNIDDNGFIENYKKSIIDNEWL